MTNDVKISMLIRDTWMTDDVAELLASKLNSVEVSELCLNAAESRKYAIKEFCERLMRLPRQRDRLAEIERLAKDGAA